MIIIIENVNQTQKYDWLHCVLLMEKLKAKGKIIKIGSNVKMSIVNATTYSSTHVAEFRCLLFISLDSRTRNSD